MTKLDFKMWKVIRHYKEIFFIYILSAIEITVYTSVPGVFRTYFLYTCHVGLESKNSLVPGMDLRCRS